MYLIRQNMYFFRTFSAFFLIFGFVRAADWGYSGKHGPDHWYKDSPDCGGSKQSPVDINSHHLEHKLDLASLNLENWDERVMLHLSNNGHSVAAAVKSGTAGMSKGGLPGNFKLAQFHFHWGQDDNSGSEHTVNGKQYPLEVHFVHFNTKYGDIGTAIDKPDGLAVLGFFFEIGRHNKAYDKITGLLNQVTYKDSPTVQVNLRLSSLLGETKHFFRYQGSLTTPGCFESVTWTVFQHPISISAQQMAEFRTLMESNRGANDLHAISFNYRPTMPLNGRKIYYSQPTSSHGDHGWTYHGSHGPSHWADLPGGAACSLRHQSPIDITPATTIYDPSLESLSFEGYEENDRTDLVLTNNGHTAQLSVVGGGNPHIFGGGLPGTFRLAQFHFHWGRDDTTGSEHTMNGYQYPLEVHWVHYNERYGSLGEAATEKDGLAVLGFFFRIVDYDNPAFSVITDRLINVRYANSAPAAITSVKLRKLLGQTAKFYRYAGSLTTPGCFESVTWTVFEEPIPISARQVAMFRDLLQGGKGDGESHSIMHNYRPTMPLNGRKVYYSYRRECARETPSSENKVGRMLAAGSSTVISSWASLLLSVISYFVIKM